jgi:hypothetical protein
LFLQILMATSFLIAGYQDFRDRMVSDLVWVPAAIGVIVTFIFLPSDDLLLLVRLVVVGVLAFVITRYGFLGEADGIAFILLAAQPAPFDLLVLLFAIAVVALSAIAYLYITGTAGRDKTIPIAQFRKEARWIPKAVIVGGEKKEVDQNVNVSREDVEKVTDDSALVVVQYGVPNIEYMAVGYLIYIGFLAIFQPNVLLSLP